MSTKSTIVYGEDKECDFHLYSECFDDENIYLEIGPTGDYNKYQTVAIPIYVWEVIRKRTNLQTHYANKTDTEIEKEVVEFVEERVAHNQGKGKTIHDIFGALCYGDVEDPIDKQIETGKQHYFALRERQKAMLDKIAELEKTQRP